MGCKQVFFFAWCLAFVRVKDAGYEETCNALEMKATQSSAFA
jgi:hypothetical protein